MHHLLMGLDHRKGICVEAFIFARHPSLIAACNKLMDQLLVPNIWIIAIFDAEELAVNVNDIRHDLLKRCRLRMAK